MKTNSFYISFEDSIQDVQDNFGELFPRLIIHFYSQNNKVLNASSPMFSPGCRIGDLSPFIKEESLRLTERMTEEEIERCIQQNFGLHAEISHKMDHFYNKKIFI